MVIASDSSEGAAIVRNIQWVLFGLVLLAVPFGLGAYSILFRQTFGVRSANVNTDITRQTNQYVTTQQQALVQKMSDYQRIGAERPGQPPTPQQKAIVEEMRFIMGTLTPEYIPPAVAQFMAGK